MKHVIRILIIFNLLATLGWSAVDLESGYSVEAFGLAEGASTYSTNGEALLLNPARIADFKANQFSINYASYFSGITQVYGTYLLQLSFLPRIMLGYAQRKSDAGGYFDTNKNGLTADNIYCEQILALAMAGNITSWLTWGSTFKAFTQTAIDKNTAWGMDIAVLGKGDWITLGLTGKNIFSGHAGADNLQQRWMFGTTLPLLSTGFLIVGDIDLMDIHFFRTGIVFNGFSNLQIKTGFNNYSQVFYGLSLSIQGISLHYGFSPNEYDNVHKMGMSLDW